MADSEPETIKPRRPTRGVFWRQTTAGDPAGSPLAGWAYRTPADPDGISAHALRQADAQVQRETATFWFLSNLRPYARDEGPYFGVSRPRPHGSGAYGVWTATPTTALNPLREEFGGVLPSDLMAQVAAALPGQWMWVRSPDEAAKPPAPEDPARAIVARLEELEAQVEQLSTRDHGLIGHNGPPEERPLSDEEKAEALKDIREAKAGLKAGGLPGLQRFHGVWPSIKKWARRLGHLAMACAATFALSYAKSAGAALGEHAPEDLAQITLAASIWHEAEAIERLVPRLPPILGG